MKSLLLSLIGLVGLIIVSGCAGSSQTAATTATAAYGQCTTGYVYSTSYGCLPQSGCSSGYALYNNSCIYVGTTTSQTCTSGYTWNGSSCVYSGVATTCQTGYTLVGNQCVFSGNTTVNTCGGTCPVGYSQTSYGCLPQYRCQTCYGYTQGYCLNTAGQYYWLGY